MDTAAPMGGGGFMTSPQFGGSQGLSQETPTKAKSNNDRSQRPVTIKMMNSATQDESESFVLDGKEMNVVTFVGCIVEVSAQSTSLTMHVEDGTGRCEVRKWLDNADQESANKLRESLREGVYIRAIGNMRTFEDKRNVLAFFVRPVTDMNEITMHQLDVIHTHLQLTRGVKSGGAGMSGGGGANMGMMGSFGGGGYQQQQQMGAPFGGVPVMQVHQQGINAGGEPQDLTNVVLQGFQDDAQSDDKGLSFQDVLAKLRRQGCTASDADLRGAFDYVCSEGHLYSTTDQDHFKCTGSNDDGF